MRRYWRSERPALFYAMFHAGEAIVVERGGREGCILTSRGKKCRQIMGRLGEWERHIPIRPDALAEWRSELPIHGNSSYAAMLRRDIKFAEECNQRGDEMIVSLRRRAHYATTSTAGKEPE